MTDSRPDSLYAVSPIDGRYADRTEPLVPFASEAGLMRARVQVEVEYLIDLADLDDIPITIDDADRRALRDIYESFDRDDAALIKRIETTGTDRYSATNHDVKAVEYFLRDRRPADLDIDPWIHFALTSEDVNNLAHRLLIRSALETVLQPAIEAIHDTLVADAAEYRSIPMLSRTHGQPATPTTYGKELAVYANRLDRARDRLDRAVDGLGGKLAGASGTYAAHVVAVPDVDWPAFAADFVEQLGFDHVPVTTQVNPCDDLAELFDALRGINAVLLDLNLDMWLYVSQGYLAQRADTTETGSSTMPHKINPIDFENSEGNLSKAMADLTFLADAITRSRLQRDLSDSTVKRNIGAVFAHCLLGYTKCLDGLAAVVPNRPVIDRELEASPAVLAEAIQTVLRAAGHDDAYERLKAHTRGQPIDRSTLHSIVDAADLDDETRTRLLALEPADYIGLATRLADDIAR